MMTAHSTSDRAITAMKYGAYDYLTKPFDNAQLISLIEKALMDKRISTPVTFDESGEEKGDRIIGRSPAMLEIFKKIGQVAESDVTVLLRGETGTGKELIARAIYHHSKRVNKPFLPVNCAAIPENLLESELFGHEKGAFTGALYNRKGRFEMADSGTIFLDEIATISTKMQVELLRVLETRRFIRVGGNKEISSDFRVICATNKDLKSMVENGTFREDLYYRLNVVNIHVPPLRDRVEDIPVLVDYFINKYCTSMNRQPVTIDDSALKRLLEYNYPGNVRELENMIERAIVVGNGKKICMKDLPLQASIIDTSLESLDEHEKNHILQILLKYNWNISRSAKALKVDRVTLYNKIKKYDFKQPSE
jgi:DNA-binding NtrC family response regulator